MTDSWQFMITAGVVVGAAAVGFVLLFRERRHRARVQQLIRRLVELERIGAGLPHTSGKQPPVGNNSIEPEDKNPRGLLSSVVSSLMRRVNTENSGPQRLDLRTLAYVNEHIDENISVHSVAANLCTSPRTLQRQLAKDLGCSPTDLIVAVRMRTAKRLLQEQNATVKKVASLVGYDDPYHFSRRFRAYYGIPPSKIVDRDPREKGHD